MWGAPHKGFARCIFWISARTSTAIGGRPSRGRAERQRQCQAKRRRCHGDDGSGLHDLHGLPPAAPDS